MSFGSLISKRTCHKSMTTTDVCIVGAGVIGLSVALYLAEEIISKSSHNPVNIVVVAESYYDKTTSFGSGGYWEPYKIEGTPDDVVNVWGKSTFDYFQTLLDDPNNKVAAGVQLLDAYHLCESDEELDIPSWKDIVKGFRVLSEEELLNIETLVPKGTLFPNKKFCSGSTFKSFTVDQSYYLKYLKDRLLRQGVTFEQKKIDNVNDLCLQNFDVVVNCCGIQGANVSCDSLLCHPIRGQVVRIRAPLMQSIWFFGTSYIIPNVDTVVCGGTAQVDDWNTSESVEDTKQIMDNICELFPSVKDAPVANVWVGLRPSRVPLRLSSEIIKGIAPHKDVLLCHCYGHGGSGVTLSWGCAEDIVVNHILPFLAPKQ